MSARTDGVRRWREVSLGLAWISPWLVGFGVFLLVPVLLSVYYSLTDYALLDVPVWIGWENYRELLSDALFWKTLRNTMVYAVLSVIGSSVLSVGLAAMLERPMRGAGLARAIIFLPTLVPVVANCVTWLWLFNPQYGLFNSAMGAAGVQGPNWLGDTRWALPSMVFMGLWVIGSPLLVCGAALKDVPESLYEAASLDGMGAWCRFTHVTLPMISPAVLFNAVMSIIWSLQVLAPPMIMTRGGPDGATLTYSMYVYKTAFEFGRMGYASALAWVQVLLTLTLAAGALWIGRKGVFYRAG
ncbi:MAG: sugar ABC transporter permease [Phycisphaerae bacterium]|nr:sugar ABC transporter permease [Phycisphaerae bacterium]